MHRSSELIGTLAAALAKAQVELTNPRSRSLLPSGLPSPVRWTAPFAMLRCRAVWTLSASSLGRHEIATVQSTSIDNEAGLLRLTTVLAHSSGEWISSEWPVCQIRDIASAQRMGAALTYARRYALFTLVGIAGEDDLDAPDLGADPNPAAEPPRPLDHRTQSNGQAAAAQRTARGDGKLSGPSARSVLGVQLSASLRESLIQQMGVINSADEAAAWAHRNLSAKNTLTAADAKIVEERFQARLSKVNEHLTPDGTSDRPVGGGAAAEYPDASPHALPDQSEMLVGGPVVKANQKPTAVGRKRSTSDLVRALGKTVRLRDKDHRKFLLRQPCLVCGRVPSDPHHLTFTQPRALGRRVSDEFTVPVCRVHHRELHRSGDEAAWWRRLNIDPLPVALRLWQQTRGNGELAPSTEGVTQARAAKTPDTAAQERTGTKP